MALITIDLSIIIVSWTRFISLGFFLFNFLSLPSLSTEKNDVCVQKNNQRQDCLSIVKITVIDEQVILNLKANRANGRTINNLDPKKFTIKVDGETLFEPATNWKKPGENPLHSRIIMLLDYSGSMKAKDSGGTPKITGAIRGIKTLLAKLAKSNQNIKVSIVPFGIPNQLQCQKYRITNQLLRPENINNQQILNRFFTPNSVEINNYLKFLQTNPPCPATATNLYDTIAKTLEFLSDHKNKELYPYTQPNSQEARLSVILLSDGFNTVTFAKGNSQAKDQKLPPVEERCSQSDLLKLQNEYLTANKYNRITIYTLGYGLTPLQLGNRYNLKRPANCQDLRFSAQETLPIPAQEFVDQDALIKIANLKNGFSDLSGNASGVAKIFADFGDAILGEYEFTYQQKNAVRNSEHQVEVFVPFENKQLSNKQRYSMSGIGGFSLPLSTRGGILIFILIFTATLGIIPFYIWAKKIMDNG